jgi:nicotinamidase-related amidase
LKISDLVQNGQRVRYSGVYIASPLLPGGPRTALRESVRSIDARNWHVRPQRSVELENFKGSGADRLERYKSYNEDGKTVIVSPHKVYGPESNDLVLQFRKRGIAKVILAVMSANLWVKSHLRELLEQGFEVAVVKDSTAAAKVTEDDGYQTAVVNYRFLANVVWTTEEAVRAIKQNAN